MSEAQTQQEKVKGVYSKGFVLLASLALKDAIQSLIDVVIPDKSSKILAQFTVAALVFVLTILVI